MANALKLWLRKKFGVCLEHCRKMSLADEDIKSMSTREAIDIIARRHPSIPWHDLPNH